jgi:hypothetical protein
MTRKEKVRKTRGEILALTDKERLLLLLMIADFSKGNIFYKDAPKKLTDVFIELLPKAAKYMTDE